MRQRLAVLLAVIVLSAACAPVAPRPAPPATAGAGQDVALRAATGVAPAGSAARPAATAAAQPDYWPTAGWRTASPESQGVDSARLADLFTTIAQQQTRLHSLLIIRHGYLVAEAYFPGFIPTRRHELWSCTKSFMSALIGIAIGEGKIEGVQARLVDYFPQRSIANLDPAKQAITLENLLTMSSGLDWHEAGNTMTSSRDWVQYVLDLPMAAAPGQRFEYSSGSSHLLSAILQAATGVPAETYAKEKLFGPLGISDEVWQRDPGGHSVGGWGLWLAPRDMARLGYLYLHGGAWDGRQVVPAAWVQDSVRPHIAATLGRQYGYQWWVHAFGAYTAQGLGGQYIWVVPRADMVVVFTADLGDQADRVPPALLQEYILPAARSAGPLPANPAAAERLAQAIRTATGQ